MAILFQGSPCVVDVFDLGQPSLKAKPKALSIHWEFMFTRSMFATGDMDAQQDLLNRVAAMIDAGTLKSTVTERGEALTVEALRAAHLRQESGRVIGKQVLGGL